MSQGPNYHMKQGTNCHLKVLFEGLDTNYIDSVVFLFSQTKDGEPLKTATYTAGAEDPEVELLDGVFVVPFTRAETYLFKRGTDFYMDTRLEMSDSYTADNHYPGDNPQTPVVPLRMDLTLFDTVDEEAEA